MKRNILHILALLLLCASLLTACGGRNGGADTTPASTDAPETTAPPKIMTLTEGKTVHISVVRPKNCSDALIVAIDKLINTISEAVGSAPKIITDWGRGRAEGDTGGAEIIIGASSYQESAAIRGGLRVGEFSVSLAGDNKIVITGFEDSDTVKAVDYFITKIIMPQLADGGPQRLTFTEEQAFMQSNSFKINTLKLGDADITSAQIVIPENYTASEYRIAVYLREHLMKLTGCRFPLVYDNAALSGHDIFVGKTKKTTVMPEVSEYEISTDGESLFIVAGSSYAYDDALKAFKKEIVPSTAENINIAIPENGIIINRDISSSLSGGTKNILVRKGEIRVMALNIWGSENGTDGKSPISQRNMQNAELILTYLPDIVGLQECSPAARSGKTGIIKLLSAKYTEVPVTFTNKYNNNYTPLLYRSDRLTLIEGGYHLYSGLNDADSKSVTWGVFRDNASGKVFGAASTHLWWQSGTESDEARELQANELDAIVTQIREKHDCDVIVFGDFNSTPTTKGCGTLISKGYVSAQLKADNTDSIRTHHAYPTYDADLGLWTGFSMPNGSSDRSIDHILVAGTSQIHTFDVVTDIIALLSSDHCPIYADITLKQ